MGWCVWIGVYAVCVPWCDVGVSEDQGDTLRAACLPGTLRNRGSTRVRTRRLWWRILSSSRFVLVVLEPQATSLFLSHSSIILCVSTLSSSLPSSVDFAPSPHVTTRLPANAIVRTPRCTTVHTVSPPGIDLRCPEERTRIAAESTECPWHHGRRSGEGNFLRRPTWQGMGGRSHLLRMRSGLGRRGTHTEYNNAHGYWYEITPQLGCFERSLHKCST